MFRVKHLIYILLVIDNLHESTVPPGGQPPPLLLVMNLHPFGSQPPPLLLADNLHPSVGQPPPLLLADNLHHSGRQHPPLVNLIPPYFLSCLVTHQGVVKKIPNTATEILFCLHVNDAVTH